MPAIPSQIALARNAQCIAPRDNASKDQTGPEMARARLCPITSPSRSNRGLAHSGRAHGARPEGPRITTSLIISILLLWFCFRLHSPLVGHHSWINLSLTTTSFLERTARHKPKQVSGPDISYPWRTFFRFLPELFGAHSYTLALVRTGIKRRNNRNELHSTSLKTS